MLQPGNVAWLQQLNKGNVMFKLTGIIAYEVETCIGVFATKKKAKKAKKFCKKEESFDYEKYTIEPIILNRLEFVDYGQDGIKSKMF